jgi:hypothetical protein
MTAGGGGSFTTAGAGRLAASVRTSIGENCWGISGASYLRAAHHGPQCAPGRNAGRRISAPKREPRLRQAAKTSVASSSAYADR